MQYPSPICRWNNPKVKNVLKLIDWLPKVELSKVRARELITQKVISFFKTHYQLACQLGLYHETNGRYFPKFTFTPTEEQVFKYLENWIIHYSVPNPYTRKFDELMPFSVHEALCRVLMDFGEPMNWDIALQTIFNTETTNKDILKNAINTYSPILAISNGELHLKHNMGYGDLITYFGVDTLADRHNKEYFFDLYSVTGSLNVPENLASNIISEFDQNEVDLVNEVQNSQQYTQTEKNQIISARIGQGVFRRNLISEVPTCPITAIDDTRLLIASHIKPWREATNDERINHKNGLLLSATFDKLFDKGLISFSEQGTLMVSSQLSNENAERLQITMGMEVANLVTQGREVFLAYHRENVFMP